MGSSPSAKIGWGVDLGSEESWGDGKLEPLGRFGDSDDDEGGQSFSDWEDNTLPALYIDKAERDARLAALRDAATSAQRAQYRADREAVLAQYQVPVRVEHYGYEFGSHALLLERSCTRAGDWTARAVDPATLAPPTGDGIRVDPDTGRPPVDDELGALRVAVESLGLTWDPADVVLLLMPQYG